MGSLFSDYNFEPVKKGKLDSMMDVFDGSQEGSFKEPIEIL